MKQNNQTSWAARLRKFSALCLALVATANVWAADKVTAFVKPGETKQLAVQLNNASAKYTAFQMTIKLPTGLQFAASDPVLVNNRKDASHKLECNKVDASTIKVVSYSYDGTTGNQLFKGESGDLLVINVTAADTYVPKNIEFSDVIFVKESLDGEGITPHVAGLLGDVNMDTAIDAQDASLVQQNVAKMIANDNPKYEIVVADVNSDGAVDAQDASLIKEFVAKMRKDFNE